MMPKMPKTQYHGTTADRLKAILRDGLALPSEKTVATMMHAIPSISTANEPDVAELYGDGTVVVVRVRSGYRYITRRMGRNVRRGERLLDAVNRWLCEAQRSGAAGVYVPDQQSGIGNQTIDPRALEVIGEFA